jgi:hypothetical protein
MIGYQNAHYWANAADARIASLPRSNTSSNLSAIVKISKVFLVQKWSLGVNND